MVAPERQRGFRPVRKEMQALRGLPLQPTAPARQRNPTLENFSKLNFYSGSKRTGAPRAPAEVMIENIIIGLRQAPQCWGFRPGAAAPAKAADLARHRPQDRALQAQIVIPRCGEGIVIPMSLDLLSNRQPGRFKRQRRSEYRAARPRGFSFSHCHGADQTAPAPAPSGRFQDKRRRGNSRPAGSPRQAASGSR
jgi:hypothetical protein